MTFDPGVKSMYMFKGIGYYYMDEKKLQQDISSFVLLMSPFY